MRPASPATLAIEAAPYLAALGNAKRLSIMLYLDGCEMPVGMIAEHVGLSQSALSQHLARLRDLGLVETRRDRQMIYYSCAPGLPAELLRMVSALFAQEPSESRTSELVPEMAPD